MATSTKGVLDSYAQRLAAGEGQSLLQELAAYLDRHPESVLETLDLYAEATNAEEPDEDNEDDIVGVLELMGRQLETLRYRLDRGYESARAIKDRFERRAAELVEDGTISGLELSSVIAAMTEAGLQPGSELAAIEESEVDLEVGDDVSIDRVQDLLRTLADAAQGEAFSFAEALIKGSRSAPADARGMLAGELLRQPLEAAREAAPLLALDPDPDVRRACAAAFLANVDGITPTSLRRLIVTRHWVPEAERHLIDQVVKAARTKGIEIAPAPAAGRTDLRCSGIDGSGAQGFMILVPQRDSYRLVSVLARYGVGILDAWCGETGTKGELLGGLELSAEEVGVPMGRQVKRDYLDEVVGHHLAVGLESDKPPPVGLLQVAEAVGAAEWRPHRLDWREVVESLLKEAPAFLQEPARIAEAMQNLDWSDPDKLRDGWYEDDPEAAEIIGRLPGSNNARESVNIIFRELLEPRREKWAAHFAWIASWLHARSPNRDPNWVRFALLARELDRGQRLAALPLMGIIAINTLGAMYDRVTEEEELKLV